LLFVRCSNLFLQSLWSAVAAGHFGRKAKAQSIAAPVTPASNIALTIKPTLESRSSIRTAIHMLGFGNSKRR
jgi:hypothetical protein